MDFDHCQFLVIVQLVSTQAPKSRLNNSLTTLRAICPLYSSSKNEAFQSNSPKNRHMAVKTRIMNKSCLSF